MMVNNVMDQKNRPDVFLWAAALVLLTVGIAIQFFLVKYPTAWKSMATILFSGLAVYAASRTSKGSEFVSFWQSSLLEVRKSVWPSRQETVQTTLAVLLMVVVMGLLLWTVDLFLLKAVAALTGRWGN